MGEATQLFPPYGPPFPPRHRLSVPFRPLTTPRVDQWPCRGQIRCRAPGASDCESLVPERDEIIRACVAAWSTEQEQFAAHMAESLESLEAYQQSLEGWQQQLHQQAADLTLREQMLEEERQRFIKQQATDVAMSAELDQARAEADVLRRRLIGKILPGTDESTADPPEALKNTTPANGRTAGETLVMSMNSVAKQFHKLRQQQAARRSTVRVGEPS